MWWRWCAVYKYVSPFNVHDTDTAGPHLHLSGPSTKNCLRPADAALSLNRISRLSASLFYPRTRHEERGPNDRILRPIRERLPSGESDGGTRLSDTGGSGSFPSRGLKKPNCSQPCHHSFSPPPPHALSLSLALVHLLFCLVAAFPCCSAHSLVNRTLVLLETCGTCFSPPSSHQSPLPGLTSVLLFFLKLLAKSFRPHPPRLKPPMTRLCGDSMFRCKIFPTTTGRWLLSSSTLSSSGGS